MTAGCARTSSPTSKTCLNPGQVARSPRNTSTSPCTFPNTPPEKAPKHQRETPDVGGKRQKISESRKASGRQSSLEVQDSSLVSVDGQNAVPKSASRSLALGGETSLLGTSSQKNGKTWEGTPGESGFPWVRKTYQTTAWHGALLGVLASCFKILTSFPLQLEVLTLTVKYLEPC